jgi:hypothetical protein
VNNSTKPNLTKYPMVLFNFRVLFVYPGRGKLCLSRTWLWCVIILTVVYLNDWSHQSNLFAHEFGHVLGAELHDDNFYKYTPDNEVIMWSEVNTFSHVWSPAARKQIMEHDLGCLENINQDVHQNMTDQNPLDEMERRNLYDVLSSFLSVKNLKNFF